MTKPLEGIVLKAMAADPTYRYSSSRALADDIKRYLSDEPLEGYKETSKDKLDRWLRQHRTVVTGAVTSLAVVLVAVTIGFVVVGNKNRSLDLANSNLLTALNAKGQALDEARDQTELANRRLYGVNMVLLQRAYNDGDMIRFRRLLSESRPPVGNTDYRGFEWRYWARRVAASSTVFRQKSGINSTTFSSDGEWLAVGSNDTTVTIRNVRNGTVRIVLETQSPNFFVSLSPDGRWCAAASGRDLGIWNAINGEKHLELADHSNAVFLPDGRLVAQNASGVVIYDVGARNPVRTFATEVRDHLAVSRDGKRLATAGPDPETGRETVHIWDVAEARMIASLAGDPQPVDLQLFEKASVSSVALSDDGRLCAVSGAKSIRIWDLSTQQVRHVIDTGNEPDWVVEFQPNGRYLATGGGNVDSIIKLYDLATGRLDRRLIGHEHHIGSFSFDPNGRRIASGDVQGEIRLWDAHADDVLTLRFKSSLGAFDKSVAFVSGGRELVAAGNRHVVLCDPSLGTVGPVLEGATHPIALARDGVTLFTAASESRMLIWDLSHPDNRKKSTLTDNLSYARDASSKALPWYMLPSIEHLAIDPDGRWIAISRKSGRIVGPHGLVLAEGLGGSPLRRLDRDGGRVSWTTFLDTEYPNVLAVSPDGLQIALGSSDERWIKFLDSCSGRELHTFRSEIQLSAACFSPDGRRFATCGDRLAILWELSTGREVLRFRSNIANLNAMTFSPDNQRLATCGLDGNVEIWDVTTGQPLLTLMAHKRAVSAVAFSPDGHRLATLGMFDGTLKIWDARPIDP